MHYLRRAAAVVLTALLLTTTVVAQWLNYPTPGVPRLPDGKPDLSGIWSGAGPSYRFNIAQDLETKDIQPWAEALFIQRVRDARMDSPFSKCLPVRWRRSPASMRSLPGASSRSR